MRLAPAILKRHARLTDKDASRALNNVLNRPAIVEFIKDLNRIDQLFKQGIDSKGETLGTYSNFTKAAKRKKNLPTDRVTLFDEGDFYKTWKLQFDQRVFEILADGTKPDKNLFDVYGDEVVGLTDQSKQKLIDRVRPLFIEENRRLYFNP